MQFDTNFRFKPYEMYPWFAWHPVLTERGILVWLEMVQRGRDYKGDYYYQLERNDG